MYIPTLTDLANVKSVLDLAVQVIRYVTRPAKLLEWSNKASREAVREAVEATINEWEQLVIDVYPELAEPLSGLNVAERARYLESAAACRVKPEPIRPSVPLSLFHTKLETSGSDARIYLGESLVTAPLRGDILVTQAYQGLANNNGESMTQPAFKVTMLGDSGSGKTVFMSSMYARLREGHRAISIRALNDSVDLELGDTMENLLLYQKWPPGTDLPQKKYDFELLVSGQSVASIDWVDYRGGALLEEPDSPDGKALAMRLRESHAIIWMVDMTRLNSQRVDGMRERIQTRVARMAAICRYAMKDADQSRAWIFVRTKADTVIGSDGKPDWHKACADLVKHLGPTTEVATSGRNSRAAALPVSSVGRVADEKPLDDDPSFVEWPLLLSLAFLAQAEMDRLRMRKSQADAVLSAERSGSVEAFVREFLRLGPKDSELAAIRSLDHVSQRLLGIHTTIGRLLDGCPPVVKML